MAHVYISFQFNQPTLCSVFHKHSWQKHHILPLGGTKSGPHIHPFKLSSQPYDVFSQSLLIKPINLMMIQNHPKRKITRRWNMLKTIFKDFKFLHECYFFFPTCPFVFLSYSLSKFSFGEKILNLEKEASKKISQ